MRLKQVAFSVIDVKGNWFQPLLSFSVVVDSFVVVMFEPVVLFVEVVAFIGAVVFVVVLVVVEDLVVDAFVAVMLIDTLL